MNITSLKTLTGLTLADLAAKLDEELPPDAYKAVPGGADLTDIDPNHMNRVLNEVFGLCGLGWGYHYDPASIDLRNGEKRIFATVGNLNFWYTLTDETGPHRFEIQATGGNDNSVAQYAMKGAITNAIGNAASKIGFQESVYLGKRDHRTVAKRKPAPPPAKPSTPAASSNGNGNGNGASPAPATPADDDPGSHVIHVGAAKGKTLREVSIEKVLYFADPTRYARTDENAKALAAAAERYAASAEFAAKKVKVN